MMKADFAELGRVKITDTKSVKWHMGRQFGLGMGMGMVAMAASNLKDARDFFGPVQAQLADKVPDWLVEITELNEKLVELSIRMTMEAEALALKEEAKSKDVAKAEGQPDKASL